MKYLSKNIFFNDVTEAQEDYILNNFAEIVNYRKGDIIFSKNDYKNSVGLILNGCANVFKSKMLLSKLQENDIFGTVTLFSSNNYFATNIIANSNCKVLFIDKPGIEYLIKYNIHFAENYISYLSNRIYFLNNRIDTLTSGNVENNLLEFIKNNADYTLDKPTLTVKSYSELAQILDSGRASLYRAMDHLSEIGYISRNEKNIYHERID